MLLQQHTDEVSCDPVFDHVDVVEYQDEGLLTAPHSVDQDRSHRQSSTARLMSGRRAPLPSRHRRCSAAASPSSWTSIPGSLSAGSRSAHSTGRPSFAAHVATCDVLPYPPGARTTATPPVAPSKPAGDSCEWMRRRGPGADTRTATVTGAVNNASLVVIVQLRSPPRVPDPSESRTWPFGLRTMSSGPAPTRPSWGRHRRPCRCMLREPNASEMR